MKIKTMVKRLLLAFGILILLSIGYFFLVRKLDNDASSQGYTPVGDNMQKQALQLPALFADSARFYFKVATTTGDTALAFGDTGGGMSMLMPDAIDKLKLQPYLKTALVKGIMPIKYIVFNDVVADKNIPQPSPLNHIILRRWLKQVSQPCLLLPPPEDEIKLMSRVMPTDFFFGQNFFVGKAWTIDYPHQQIWVNTTLAEGLAGVQHTGFKKNAAGNKLFGHPSFTIEVDGEILEMLFDTGATIILSEEGKKVFGGNQKTIAGSFIAASVFDAWRKKHPEWDYYPKADLNNDLIKVPVVKIGGFSVGPVLFAKRPDEAWSRGMINTMDKVVKGAIGGSALKYLKVTIDYNSELIRFEQ